MSAPPQFAVAATVTFHLPNGKTVEAKVIGWETRSDAIGRAVVTVMQPKAELNARTEG